MYCAFYKAIIKSREILNKNYDRFDDNLACACAIASCYVFIELQKQGLSPIICVKRGGKLKIHHVYVYCNDFAIDATATQFNRGKIFIKHRTELLKLGNLNLDSFKGMISYNWWVMPTEIFDSVDDLITYQYETQWPNYQIAEEKELKYI